MRSTRTRAPRESRSYRACSSTRRRVWNSFFRRLYLHDQRPSAPCEIRSATTRTHGVSSSSLDAPELLIERPRGDIRDRTTVANADAYAAYATKRHEIVMTCQVYEILFIFFSAPQGELGSPYSQVTIVMFF